MKKIHFVAIVFLLTGIFTGCVPKVETSKSINYLRLSEVTVEPFEKPVFDTVKIKNISGADYIFHRDFIYSYKEGFYNRYAFHKWHETVANQIENLLFVALKKSNLFKNALSKNSIGKANYLLEAEIFTFEQILLDNMSLVKVEMNINLIDAKSDKIIASKMFASKIETKKATAESALFGYNKAMTQIVNEIFLWLKEIGKKGKI